MVWSTLGSRTTKEQNKGEHIKWWHIGIDANSIGINKVALCHAQLRPRWLTVSGFNCQCGKFISI